MSGEFDCANVQRLDFSRNLTKEAVQNIKNEALKDWNRAKDNYEKEGATPAILDTISGIGNVGKNVLRGVKAQGDRLAGYTKSGNEGIDNIGHDGLLKTAGGLVGVATETVGCVAAIFSTEDGSKTRALGSLVNEAAKTYDGGKNTVLGIFGKGWLWGKDKEDEPPKVEEKVKLQEVTKSDDEKNVIKAPMPEFTIPESDEGEIVDEIKHSESKTDNSPEQEASVIIEEALKRPVQKDVEDALNFFKDEEVKTGTDIEAPKRPVQKDVEDALNFFKDEEVKTDTDTEAPKRPVQKDLEELLRDLEAEDKK